MELDEIKLAWQALDLRMAKSFALDLETYKERKLASARSGLGWVKLGLLLQMLLGIAMIVIFASFWVAHRHVLHFVVSGMLLQAYGMLLVVCSAREMHMIRDIDYAAPVLTIQRK